MSIVGFNKKKKEQSVTTTVTTSSRITTKAGKVVYCTEDTLPSSAEEGTLIVTIDENNIYVGKGLGRAIEPTNNIFFADALKNFPKYGKVNTLYVSRSSAAIYLWAGTGYLQMTGGTGTGTGGEVIIPKDFVREFFGKERFPQVGELAVVYVDTKENKVYRYDASGYVLLTKDTIYDDAVLKAAVALKAEKTELAAFRKKTDSILEADLGADLAAKVNRGAAGYDDSTLKSQVAAIQLSKADKTDIVGLRKSSDPILETDLGEALAAKVNRAGSGYDDTALKASITALQTGKAEKTEVADCRKKADPISEADLTPELAVKVSDAKYDDSALKADVTTLKNDKADKTALVSYRSKAEAVVEADLSLEVRGKLNAISAGYNDTAIKADITSLKATKADAVVLAGYRIKADTILEEDLDAAVIAKLNAVSTGYNDSAIKADITSLKSTKADKTELIGYRSKTQQIAETDLTPELAAKLGSSGGAVYDDSVIKNDVAQLELNKADKTALASYRAKSESITEADLSVEVQTKIADALVRYDDTSIKAEVATLKSESATKVELTAVQTAAALKTDLDLYRKKADPIAETDLTTELKTKIADALVRYDDLPVKNDIAALQAGKADKTALTTFSNIIDQYKADMKTMADRIAILESVSNVTYKQITSVAAVADKTGPLDATLSSFNLPTTLVATLNDASTVNVNVAWYEQDYNGALTTKQTVFGALSGLPATVKNPSNVMAQVNITLVAGAPLWSCEFVLDGPGANNILINDIPGFDMANKFTLEDFYGPALDGNNPKVEIRWIGYVGNRMYDPDGVPHPNTLAAAAGAEKLSPDGAVDWDPDTNIIQFTGASLSKRIYRILRKA